MKSTCRKSASFPSWPASWLCTVHVNMICLLWLWFKDHQFSRMLMYWLRSYQSSHYSCWNQVSPVDSSGMLVEFTSQNFTPATELCHSGIYSRMVPRVLSPEWHWNPVTGMELKNAKYQKFCILTWKITIKLEENRYGGGDVGVLFPWSVQISQYGN